MTDVEVERSAIAAGERKVRLWPTQIEAPGTAGSTALSLRDRFAELLPRKPYATDNPGHGVRILGRSHALKLRLVQFNDPTSFRWMVHDIDVSDAYFVHRDAYVAQPNVIAVNPDSGRAHAAYLLATPVARHSAARTGPLAFFAAVERGIARRIGADRRYTGVLAKNPLHPDWRVEWRREQSYTLGELADWLFPRDVLPDPSVATTFGSGRNCALFDELRSVAYREVRSFKRVGDIEAFHRRLQDVALQINSAFPVSLGPSEVRSIVKSVHRWTWTHFTEATFSRRQAALGQRGATKRWAGHVTAEKTKPWVVQGISRSTWYRRRRGSTA